MRLFCHRVLWPLVLLGSACIADGSKSDGAAGAAASETGRTAEIPPDFGACQAWLAGQTHPGVAEACDRDPTEDLAQIAADGAGVVQLASGRTAIGWFPEDWETRDQQSILVVLHGTVGCAEASWAIFRRLLSDDHALVALEYKSADGRFAEAREIQADLDETASLLAGACPIEDAAWLMHGVSRGGARAVQLAGLDREGPQRLAGVAVDSGTLSPSEFNGLDMGGAHLWLWCGEFDPDPRGGGATTCDVMENQMAPAMVSAGATVDALVVGEAACHGMFGWDCSADCSSCASNASPRELGPGVTAFSAWTAERLGG